MGSYTHVNDWDIEMNDFEGFKFMVQEFAKIEDDKVWLEAIDEDKKTVNFMFMDDWKIISYWYANEVAFFKLCSKFMDGELHLLFEDDSPTTIIFQEGDTIFEIGRLEFDTLRYKDLIKNNVGNFDKDFEKFKELIILHEV